MFNVECLNIMSYDVDVYLKYFIFHFILLIVWFFFFFFLMVCNGQLVQILCHFAVKNMHFRSNDVEESTDLQTGGFFISCFFLFVLNTCKSVIAHFFPELCSWQGHMCYFNVHMYMFNTEIFLCLFNIVTFSFLLLYINHINM